MNYFLDTATVVLTCLTPIHIGHPKTYTQADYVVTSDGKRILLLDDIKLFSYLKEKGLIGQYKRALLDKRFNLTSWVRRQGFSDNDLIPFASNYIRISSDYQKEKNSFNEIVAYIRLSNGNPYIPGSSIKGAVRTLLINYFLNNKKMDGPSNLIDEIIRFNRTYRPGDSKNKNAIKHITRNVEKSIVIKGELGRQKKSVVDRLMQNIRISDAELIDSVETELFQKHDVTYSKKLDQYSVNDLPIWRECLPVGTKLIFTLTFDKRIENLSSIQSVDDILDALHEQTQRTLQLEDDNLPFDTSEYRSGVEVEADLILGGGTGFTSKTLLNELIDNKVEAVKFINNSLNINFKQRKNRVLRRGQTLAPETLKVVQAQPNQYVEMGLCKLELE